MPRRRLAHRRRRDARADNGIGIAAMMAVAEDPSLPHGRLELLTTVGDEVGGEGVRTGGLDHSLVTGTTLLNLDSEEDGALTVGSASTTDTSLAVDKPREACEPGAVTLSVSASGGLGGHPGSDIAHGRANAIKGWAARSAKHWPSLHSGLSRWTAARAGTPSHGT